MWHIDELSILYHLYFLSETYTTRDICTEIYVCLLYNTKSFRLYIIMSMVDVYIKKPVEILNVGAMWIFNCMVLKLVQWLYLHYYKLLHVQKTKPKSSIILWEKQTGYLKTILQTNIVTLASEIMMPRMWTCKWQSTYWRNRKAGWKHSADSNCCTLYVCFKMIEMNQMFKQPVFFF